MTTSELTALMDGVADVLREAIAEATAPLLARIALLEAREPIPGANGRDGVDGHDADPAVVAAFVQAEVAKAVAKMPVPTNGSDGRDGHSVTAEDVQPLIRAEVAQAMAAVPIPKDGTSITVDDVTPLITREVAQAVAQIPVPKDGIGIAHAVIDSTGHLLVTFSDATTKDVGVVVGPAGQDGRDGMPGVPGRPGEKGLDGRDGSDGLGFDDIAVEFDGERRYTFAFVRGERRKVFGSFVNPTVIYRGIWNEGRSYDAWDQVTLAGCQWIAKRTTTSKPDDHGPGAQDWQLCVKRGRDGKEGKPGPQGPIGPRGPQGERGPRWS